MKIVSLICIVLIVINIKLYPQSKSIEIRGFIKDKLTNERIIGAVILTDGIAKAVSDSVGFFRFNIISSGKYILSVQMIGYDKFTKEIDIKEDEYKKELFLRITPKPVLMEKVTITGEEYNEYEDFKTYELRNGELTDIPVFLESDALRAIQALPGVTLSHDLSNLIFLRGGNFDETMISLDGVPLYNSSHLGGVFGNFSSDIIKKISLFPSNYPVEYGGYLSGIMDIQTKSGNSERVKGNLSVGLISSKLFVEAPIGNSSIIFSARRTYLDLVANLFDDLGYYFYDFFGKVNIPINKNNLITVSGFYSKDVYSLFENTLNPKELLYKNEDANWGNKYIKFSYLTLMNKLSITVDAYYANSSIKGDAAARDISKIGRQDFINGKKEYVFINNYINDLSISLKTEYKLPGNLVSTGIIYRNLSTNNNWNINESDISSIIDGKIPDVFYDFAPDSVDFSDQSNVYSYFISNKLNFTKKLDISFGYRGSYIQKLKSNVHSFNFKVNYKINNDVKSFFSYGKYYQYFRTKKEILNSSIFAPFASYFFADDKNNISKTDHYSLGFSAKNIFGLFQFELEGYYKKREKLPSININAKNLDYINGSVVGFDALIKKRSGSLEGWISYSFSRSIKEGTSYKYYSNYDRTHNIKLLLQMEPWENWEVNTFWIYSSGLPYTPVIGKYVKGTINGFDWDLEYGRKNSFRYRDYHRLDIGIAKSFIWNKFIVKFFLQIINVYNSQNPFNYNPSPSDTDNRNGGEKASYLIPTIGIRIEH